MIQKKSLIPAIKRALQTGAFNYMSQQLKMYPKELFNIDSINFDDQNWWQCIPITKIDVSNNQIKSIPEQIVVLPDIQLIRMKSNLLQEFPKCVLKLQFIKSLDFFKNKIGTLPNELSYNRTLVELNFGENFIQKCPDLSQIDTLEHVYFNDNRFKQLPNFGKGLRKLQASNNKIRFIRRQNLWLCNQLQTLNLNKNMIQKIQSQSFKNLTNLVLLQMKQNRLCDFPSPSCQKLSTLNLAYNGLSQCPQLSFCPSLSILILSNNKLLRITSEIIKLQKLKNLDLQNNNLGELPYELGFMTSLVKLQVEGNPLKTIRQNVRNSGTQGLKKYLKDRMPPEDRQKVETKVNTTFQADSTQNQYWNKLVMEFCQAGELTLRNMKLTQIDQIVYQKTNIKGINFENNQIKQISQQIGCLVGLKTLILSKNMLQSLPCSLGQLPVLQSIQAKNNRLSTFGSLKHSQNKYTMLKHLDLSANRFCSIPKPILLLQNLRTLYMGYNQLKSVDEIWEKGNLPLLEILDLSNNSLNDLSDQVFYKQRLNFLNLENNNLTKLPTVLGFMKLSSLKVDGNPLKLIKRTIIQKGTVALLEFLKTKHCGQIPQPPQQLIEQKIQIQQNNDPQQNWPYLPSKKLVKNTPVQSSFTPSQNSTAFTHPSMQTPYKNYCQQQNHQIPQQIDVYQSKQMKVKHSKQVLIRVEQLQIQILAINKQIDINYTMSSVIKNQKKKQLQQLMIQKNKLLKL